MDRVRSGRFKGKSREVRKSESRKERVVGKSELGKSVKSERKKSKVGKSEVRKKKSTNKQSSGLTDFSDFRTKNTHTLNFVKPLPYSRA